ncbi:MAG: MlaD family protein [Cyanobacteria bacterium P01_H01_bin.162]
MLILIGIAMFGSLIFWLRAITQGGSSYSFVVVFASAGGAQVGTPVNYRGITVGKVIDIRPQQEYVEFTIEIANETPLFPKNSYIFIDSSDNFFGQATVYISPNISFSSEDMDDISLPTNAECEPRLIICNGDKITGGTYNPKRPLW